jgi:hypothetical protein
MGIKVMCLGKQTIGVVVELLIGSEEVIRVFREHDLPSSPLFQ